MNMVLGMMGTGYEILRAWLGIRSSEMIRMKLALEYYLHSRYVSIGGSNADACIRYTNGYLCRYSRRRAMKGQFEYSPLLLLISGADRVC